LAALIHDASNFPLEVLKAVPYEGWCIEVQRFIDQIRSQTIAFSGWKFFNLTRPTILAMLATIVTYELVLLDFDNDSQPVDKNLNSYECGALKSDGIFIRSDFEHMD
jgi:gustatory receptor